MCLICRISSVVERRFCKPLVGGSSFTRHHKINGLGSKRTRHDIAHLVFSMQAPILPPLGYRSRPLSLAFGRLKPLFVTPDTAQMAALPIVAGVKSRFLLNGVKWTKSSCKQLRKLPENVRPPWLVSYLFETRMLYIWDLTRTADTRPEFSTLPTLWLRRGVLR